MLKYTQQEAPYSFFLERATFRADLASSQQAIPLLLSDDQHLLGDAESVENFEQGYKQATRFFGKMMSSIPFTKYLSFITTAPCRLLLSAVYLH
jgi:hypothetical protein